MGLAGPAWVEIRQSCSCVIRGGRMQNSAGLELTTEGGQELFSVPGEAGIRLMGWGFPLLPLHLLYSLPASFSLVSWGSRVSWGSGRRFRLAVISAQPDQVLRYPPGARPCG